MTPAGFRPFHNFPRDMDDAARADWMLKLLDGEQDHTALIAIPIVRDDDELDALEDDFRRAYDLAREGRSLGVKFLHAVDDNGPTPGASRVVVMLHEHRWVGGHCLNGCSDTREAA